MQEPSLLALIASPPVRGLTAMAFTAPRWSFMLATIALLPAGDTCGGVCACVCVWGVLQDARNNTAENYRAT